jgi:hypothetical protein
VEFRITSDGIATRVTFRHLKYNPVARRQVVHDDKKISIFTTLKSKPQLDVSLLLFALASYRGLFDYDANTIFSYMLSRNVDEIVTLRVCPDRCYELVFLNGLRDNIITPLNGYRIRQ